MTRVFVLKGPARGPSRVRLCLAGPVSGEEPGAGAPRREAWARGGTGPARAQPAHDTLTPAERALMESRGAGARARADFVAGRLAAHVLLPGSGILAGPDGAPVISGVEEGSARPSLSLAHSGGWGLAGVVDDAGWKVGVDLEARRFLDDHVARRVLTSREQRRVARSPAGRRGGMALRHWVIKEAALKASGGKVASLLADPAVVEIVRLPSAGWADLAIKGRATTARGRVVRRRGLTIAAVVMRAEPPSAPPR